MALFDFHVHSCFSDGVLTPKELIKQAVGCGVEYLALTDHDNTNGLEEAAEEAKKAGIKFIKGVEISSRDDDCPVIHMLGFHIKDRTKLEKVEKANADSLRERNGRILNYLRENCNIDIKISDLYDYFKGSVGKGNIAIYMKQKGYTQTYKEAEDLMRPYKAGGYGVDVKEAINAIHEAGGLAFLAHPHSLKKNDEELLKKFEEFKDYGLDGIECFHSYHSIEQTELYLQYAKKLGLKVSGGSDFHGEFKADVRMGYGKGDVPLIQNEFISIEE